jgi:hypothetical protein
LQLSSPQLLHLSQCQLEIPVLSDPAVKGSGDLRQIHQLPVTQDLLQLLQLMVEVITQNFG